MISKIKIIGFFLFVLLVILVLLNFRKTKESFNNNTQNIKFIELNSKPRILLLKNFLTTQECDHIIKIGDPHIKNSEVCGKNGSRPDKSRTSMTAHIGKKFLGGANPDKILLNILQKSEDYCGLSQKNIEPIQLVRYEPGQYFKPHYDYLDSKNEMYRRNIEKNGQRKYTFFVYLTDVPEGVGGE